MMVDTTNVESAYVIACKHILASDSIASRVAFYEGARYAFSLMVEADTDAILELNDQLCEFGYRTLEG